MCFGACTHHEHIWELQVTSRKRATNYRALLRKMTYKSALAHVLTMSTYESKFLAKNSFGREIRRHSAAAFSLQILLILETQNIVSFIGLFCARALLQKSPIKETIFCQRDLDPNLLCILIFETQNIVSFIGKSAQIQILIFSTFCKRAL